MYVMGVFAVGARATTGPVGLDEVVRRYEAKGFTGQFVVRAAERLLCTACRAEPDPRDVSLLEEERWEGTSAPDEQAVVLCLQCPRCKAKGTLVLSYGPGAPREDAAVFSALRDARGQ